MDNITRNGVTYSVELEHDGTSEAPWGREDGHGEVSDWTTRSKKAGERVLISDGRSKRFYDFAGAVAKARAEGWDAPPYKTGTKGQQAARAAEADFQRLRAWCNDEWSYIGVVVTELCACCNSPTDKVASLWGIESDASDYLDEVANELIDELEG